MFKPEIYKTKKEKEAIQLKKEGTDLIVVWYDWNPDTGETIPQSPEIVQLSELETLKAKYQQIVDSIDDLIKDLKKL